MRKNQGKITGVATITAILLNGEAVAQSTGSCVSSHVRWASTSNTVYISGPSTCTLTDIRDLVSKKTPPLIQDAENGAIWYLTANLKLELGATLVLHGTSIGGDVDELRLRSNNTSSANRIVYLRAQWGNIDINATKITSWDEAANGPDTEYSTYGRSYIHVRSFLDTNGVTPRESRMDITDSEIAYLGYAAAEAYGLVWKVYGTQPGLYDKVDVRGEIKNAHIHHNYFGAYTYGAYQMHWENNVIENNIKYGLDPHDDSDYLVITGNISRHNGDHGIICSQRCDHLTITNNTVYGNDGNGIMLHRSVTDSEVSGNVLYNNADAGIALFESYNNIIRNNNIYNNYRGVRFSVGSHDNVIRSNNIHDNTDTGIYAYQGNDIPQERGNDGRPKKNTIDRNTIADNSNFMLKLRDSDDFVFVNNTFRGKAKIEFTAGTGNTLEDNALPDHTIVNTLSGTSPTGVYTAGATTIETGTAIITKLAADAIVEFVDQDGRIYDAEENQDPNRITAGGSELLLDSSVTGTQSIVTPLAFWVKTENGPLDITIRSWNSAAPRRWTAANGGTNQSIEFRFGDLVPGQRYTLSRDGVSIRTATADVGGQLSFTVSIAPNVEDVFEVR